jgi:hypothetical protein
MGSMENEPEDVLETEERIEHVRSLVSIGCS